MTHLSLCSGIGGVDLAAEAVGFESVAFVEREPFCQQVLAKNFPGVKIHGDIKEFDGKEYAGTTLVSAGWPCQPHSVAGKREASGDERDLWSEVVRVLGEVRPRWFLGENVPGLLSSESGTFFGRCLNDLARLGYRVGWGVWGANDVGAVHRRRRIFIVAYAEHDGPFTAALGRSVGESQDEGRLLQPERCSTPNPNSKRGQVSAQGEQPAKPLLDGKGKAWRTDDTTPNPKAVSTERTGRHTRDDVSRSLGRGDWRQWGIPAAIPERGVCRQDDGIPARLVRSRRNATVKVLGKSVVPAQVLPLLEAIAEYERGL